MAVKWESIDKFLLQCGSKRTPEDLGNQIMDSIGELIPFDQGRLYFLDGNGNVQKERLIGVKKKEAMEYHDFYSKVDDRRYSTPSAAAWFSRNYPPVERCIFNEASYGSSRFYSEYVRALNIKYSFGLGLRSDAHSLKCLISLDRTSVIPYSPEEIETMAVIRPHLDNQLQCLYADPPGEEIGHLHEDEPLTPREREITSLLLDGVTPQNIGIHLCISYTTVKKHMDNIYKKLHINNIQELFLKMLKK
ncbi:MAG: helix-turn-helix transcriptional regulator [Eubacterium sp.]|nr:helix-turn-helix transcriptional regulator [Eubacterium sp.]